MTEQKKMPNATDLEVLQIVHAAGSRTALMPIIFNGQERFGLMLIQKNEAGVYVRMLAVLPLPGDVVTDGDGHAPSFTPPVVKSELN